jgi:hypothetical protein
LFSQKHPEIPQAFPRKYGFFVCVHSIQIGSILFDLDRREFEQPVAACHMEDGNVLCNTLIAVPQEVWWGLETPLACQVLS